MNARGYYGNTSRRGDRAWLGAAPFGTPSGSYDDVWTAQRNAAARSRGTDKTSDRSAPLGPQGPMDIPRTTNREAVELAAYWQRQIETVGLAVPTLMPGMQRIRPASNWNYVLDLWKPIYERAVAAVSFDPNAIYPSNSELWRGAFGLAVELAITKERPSDWSQLAEAFEERYLVPSLRPAPQPLVRGVYRSNFVGADPAGTTGGAYNDVLIAQRDAAVKARGSDKTSDPSAPLGPQGSMIIPRTTNRDAVELASYWQQQADAIAKVANWAHPLASNWNYVLDQWKPIYARAMAAKEADPNTIYAGNSELWRGAFYLAVQLAITKERPSEWSLLADALKQSIKDLPGRLERGAGAVWDVGKYVAIGAAVIVGAVVLTKAVGKKS